MSPILNKQQMQVLMNELYNMLEGKIDNTSQIIKIPGLSSPIISVVYDTNHSINLICRETINVIEINELHKRYPVKFCKSTNGTNNSWKAIRF